MQWQAEANGDCYAYAIQPFPSNFRIADPFWNRKKAFDPKRAIHFMYDGELEELVAEVQSGRER